MAKKRQTRSPLGKSQAHDPAQPPTGSHPDPRDPETSSPAYKQPRTEKDQTMPVDDTLKALLARMDSLMAGQEDLKASVQASLERVTAEVGGLKAQVLEVSASLKALQQDVETKTATLRATTTTLEEKVAVQAKQLDNITEVLKEERLRHLTVKVFDKQCQGNPEAHVRTMLTDMQHLGTVEVVRHGAYMEGENKVHLLDFKVASSQAAWNIRKQANAFADRGVIKSLGLFKTKHERVAEGELRRAAPFKRALEAATAAKQKVRWGFGSCTINGEVWTPERVASAGQQA